LVLALALLQEYGGINIRHETANCVGTWELITSLSGATDQLHSLTHNREIAGQNYANDAKIL